jgi:hypothetical protein
MECAFILRLLAQLRTIPFWAPITVVFIGQFFNFDYLAGHFVTKTSLHFFDQPKILDFLFPL